MALSPGAFRALSPYCKSRLSRFLFCIDPSGIHMIIRRHWLGTVILALGLPACASLQQVPTAPYVAPAPSDMATIYVFRALSMPTRANVEVRVDGRRVALLPDNRLTWFRVAPGRHVFEVGDSFVLATNAATLELEVSAQGSYALRYLASAGAPGIPLFGLNGKYMGTAQVGPASWRRLVQEPLTVLDVMTAQLPYVVADAAK
jgi:hypothetical protein